MKSAFFSQVLKNISDVILCVFVLRALLFPTRGDRMQDLSIEFKLEKRR